MLVYLTGNRLGRDDPLQKVWLAHLKAQERTPVLILENVPEQPASFVQECLPRRNIYRIVASPRDVGYKLMNRTRAYSVCVDPKLAELTSDIYNVWEQVRAT